ncbi:MAG: hypothetical protein AVDCRST_MAG30-2918 [uncultured Solirubrobacteraceae bacterium]|uniref:Uncharacterized protein n=1 Tax=uncultured Solirubrobacteraceae bacterium TaxID=1162706 RepID=A0A6J4TAX6_9ACTN|nr:MAG: hypothetical protein AVDCRST_MAG30-2918 [uncultured Solirubrobacteraceae bacterium]
MSKSILATLALAIGIGMAARSQAPELQRYLKIKKM